MSVGAESRVRLLRTLYSSLGEFLAWTQLYESLGGPLSPSPFVVIPWMRAFIRIIEDGLTELLGTDEVLNYTELHLGLCCRRYRSVRALLECIFHM